MWATWLHKKLETYDIPEELRGTTNKNGQSIPQKIFPVFRDEAEFSTASNLAQSIKTALEQSETLVVLCSPQAVESPYVTEEIRYFKSLNRSKQIIPVILAGDPSSIKHGCFPESLKHNVAPDGSLILDTSIEPLAADLRLADGTEAFTDIKHLEKYLKNKSNISSTQRSRILTEYTDDSHLAFLKIVASILGIPLATLTKRDQAHQLAIAQKRASTFRRVASAMALLLALAIAAGIYAQKKRIEAVQARDSANELVNFMVTDLYKQLQHTGRLDTLSSTVSKVDEHLKKNPTPPSIKADLRLQQAKILFGQGKILLSIEKARQGISEIKADGTLLSNEARLRAFLGDVIAWKKNGNSTAKKECIKALKLFEAVDQTPATVESRANTLIALADIQKDSGDIRSALETYQRAWAKAESLTPKIAKSAWLARYRHAELCHLHDFPDLCDDSIKAALKLADEQLDQIPNSHPWLARKAQTLILQSTYERFSDLLQSYRTLQLAEKFAEQANLPGQLHWQALLSTVHNHMAMHPYPNITLADRIKFFERAISTQRFITRESPSNRGWSATLASTLRDYASFNQELQSLYNNDTHKEIALKSLRESLKLLSLQDTLHNKESRIETLIRLAAISPQKEAHSLLKEAHGILSQIPKKSINTHLLWAIYLAATNDHLESNKYLMQAKKMAKGARLQSILPFLAANHFKLAEIALHKGETNKFHKKSSLAINDYEQLVKLANQREDALETLARAYNTHARLLRDVDIEYAKKQYQSASSIFTSIIAKYPNYAAAYRELAFSQYQIGKIASKENDHSSALKVHTLALSNYKKFLEKSSLTQTPRLSIFSFSSLKILYVITAKKANAAAEKNNHISAAKTWISFIQFSRSPVAASINDKESLNLQDEATYSAIQSISKADYIPEDMHDQIINLIANFELTSQIYKKNPQEAKQFIKKVKHAIHK